MTRRLRFLCWPLWPLAAFSLLSAVKMLEFGGAPGQWARYGRWEAGSVGELSFSLKTNISKALVLYLDDGGNCDFLELLIAGGRLQLRFAIHCAEPATLHMETRVNDDRWHMVLLTRNFRATLLMVDAETKVAEVKSKRKEMAVVSDLFVGGIPPDVRLSALTSSTVKYEPPFLGLISNLKVGEMPPTLLNSQGIQSDLEYLCTKQNPCFNGGFCSIQYGEVHCDCSHTRFKGKYCKEAEEYVVEGLAHLTLNDQEELTEPLRPQPLQTAAFPQSLLCFYLPSVPFPSICALAFPPYMPHPLLAPCPFPSTPVHYFGMCLLLLLPLPAAMSLCFSVTSTNVRVPPLVLSYGSRPGPSPLTTFDPDDLTLGLKTLRDFQYIDRDGRDQGANVREKARQLVCLLRDEERLRQERSQALKTKERMAGGGSGGGGGVYGGIPPSYHPGRRTSQPSMAVLYGEEFSRSRGSPCSFNSSSSSPHAASDLEQARPQTSGEEELQLQLALAMSREESQKLVLPSTVTIAMDVDIQLQVALSLSQREHEQEQRCRQGDESLLQKALDESRRESQSGTRESAMLDLVDIFGSSSEPPPSSTDPWNSVQTNSDINSDTWDTVAVHSSTPVVGSPWVTPQPSSNTSNPWAPCTKPHTDPWEAVPVSSSPVSHEWDSPTDTTTGCEGTDPFMAQDMEKPKQDVPQVSSPQPASPTDAEVFVIKTESDPFSGLESKADVFGTEPVKPQVNGRESTSPEMFDLSRLAPPLSAPAARLCRTPEAFLGPTGASLVNLDALIPTNPPSKMHNNPFLSGLSAPSPTNPFHCDQPRLTLNQMRPSSTSPLPPHMLSYSPSLPLPLPHQPPTLPSSLTQPPAGLLDLPSNLPQPLIPLCPRPAPRTQSHMHSHNPFL